MTEAEWLARTRPQRMLRQLRNEATDRRLRLLAVACESWSSPFPGPPTEAILRAVERVADGAETADDIVTLDALRAWERRSWNAPPGEAVTVAGMREELPTHRSNLAERAAQCDLIRCIFGNPFRPVAFDSAWLTSTAVALAASIYESRAFHDLPILADALEDAGCDDAGLLGHLRGGGPHSRGCWAVDLVLGKG